MFKSHQSSCTVTDTRDFPIVKRHFSIIHLNLTRIKYYLQNKTKKKVIKLFHKGKKPVAVLIPLVLAQGSYI